MHYRFIALDNEQQLIHGVRSAASRSLLAQELRDQGMEILSARPALPPRPIRLSRAERADFCQQTGHLLKSGIPLQQALHDLSQEADIPSLGRFAAELGHRIAGGQSLSGALGEFPRAFSGDVIGIIAAGEYSGRLDEILLRLADTLRRTDREMAKLRTLLLKPALAAGMVLAASGFLMFAVVPQIRLFLNSLGIRLPWHSRALFSIADFLEANWPEVLASLVVIPLIAGIALKLSPALRLIVSHAALNLPGIGKLLLKQQTTLFAELLSLMYAAGIPLNDALRQIGNSIPNAALRANIQSLENAVLSGLNLSTAMAADRLYPASLVRAISIGESTGELDNTLILYARRCSEESERTTARLQAAIEPALTLCIGLILGWIMTATLQPVYDIVGGAVR